MELTIGIVGLIVSALALYIAYLQLRRTPGLSKNSDDKSVSRHPSTIEPRVFLSYARKDGEKFALELLRKIEAEDIPCWLDRVEMKGGQDWWNQIREALDVVDYLVLVMTPGAIKSEWTQKEWIYARQQGVCVLPVIAVKDLDFKSLPRWMRDAHFHDLDHEWHRFINDLNTRCEKVRVPFMVEDLPKNFVHRPVEFEKIVTSLLYEGKEEPKAITTALKGAGGFGKTTLALAICHDERIIRVFDDGILWVTLGENPGDIVHKISDLIIRLSGQNPGYTTVEAASDHLAELLADRDILMVVDDVWDLADLRPFLRGGARCTRLITTRDSATLPSGVQRINVDEMQPQEALELLGMGLSNYDVRDLQTLTARLGEWPILLNLVNARLNERLQGGQSLPDALSYIDRVLEKNGVTAFDIKDSSERNKAIGTTLGLSLELLDENEKARFLELAVFPEDVKLPLDTLIKYWRQTGNWDDIGTEQLCERLFRLSLLQRYDPATRRISIHDVVRGYLIGKVRDEITAFHHALLDAYNLDRWSELPEDEPYMWEHLIEHLVGAMQIDELLKTVKDLEYLERKTWVRKAYSVEKDLRLGAEISKDETIQSLYRIFRASSHLLNQCSSRKDLKATLCGRFLHVQATKQLAVKYAETIESPWILPNSQPPDLPHPAQIRALSGHTGSLNSILINQDNKVICSGAGDDTLRIWDAESGELRHAIEVYKDVSLGDYEGTKYPGGVHPIAINQDGSTVITKAGDDSLRIWDSREGTLLRTTLGNTAVAGPNNETFILEATDFSICMWNIPEGKVQCRLEGHWNSVCAIAESLDGSIIVSASLDRTIRIWDVRNKKVLHILNGHLFPAELLALSSDGKTIFSGCTANDLRVWDVESGKLKYHLKSKSDYPSRIDAIAISADSKAFFIASMDGLEAWDAQGVQFEPITEQRNDNFGTLVNSQGTTFYVAAISGSNNHVITIWDINDRTLCHQLECQGGPITFLRISQDQRAIISFTEQQVLQIWDIYSGDLLITIRNLTFNLYEATTMISIGTNTVVLGSKDNTLSVWDTKNGELRYVLVGQQNPVISPDGKIIISYSEDNTLNAWDALTGELQYILKGHNGRVRNILFGPDSNTVVYGSNDRTLRLWNLQDGEARIIEDHWDFGSTSLMYSLDGHTIISIASKHSIQTYYAQNGGYQQELEITVDCGEILAISSNGHNFISSNYNGSGDYIWQLWNARTGELLHTLKGGDDRAAMVFFSSDGKFIISNSRDGTSSIWDIEDGEVRYLLNDSACGAKISLDGHTMVSGSHKVIQVWDVQSNNLRHTLTGHTDDVKILIVSADGNTMISGAADGTLRRWNLGDGKLLGATTNHIGELQLLTLSYDGSILISGTEDNTIRMWDVGNEIFWSKQEDSKYKLHVVTLSPDGSAIFSHLEDGILEIWNIEDGKLLKIQEIKTGSATFRAASSDGSVVVLSSGEDKLQVWNTRTRKLREILLGSNSQKYSDEIRVVTISADGNYIAAGFYYSNIRVWDAKSGNLIHTLNQLDNSALEVVFSPDGNSIISGIDDNSMLTWDSQSGKLRHAFKYPRHPWYSYYLCCNDNIIVSDSMDHDLWVWNVQNGHQQHVLKGHTDRVNGIAISPDSQVIVSASDDNTLRVWDAKNGKLQHVLKGHTRSVQALSISPNGRIIVSGSLDNTLRLWDLETGQYIGGICVDGEVEYCAWHKSGKHIVARGKGGSYIFDYFE